MVDIKGYEGKYAITSCGKVWSYKTKKFLSTHKNSKGYKRVYLCKGNGGKLFAIHRLVAKEFLQVHYVNATGENSKAYRHSCPFLRKEITMLLLKA